MSSTLAEQPYVELRSLHHRQLVVQLGLVLSLILLIIFFAIKAPYFFTTANFENILLQISIVGMLALAQTLVIVSGGIDLSVGATLGLAGVCAAFVAQNPDSGLLFPLLAGIGVGAAVGFLFNGAIIALTGISAFIITLASLSTVRGISLALTDTLPVAGLNSQFVQLGSAEVLGLPMPVIIFLGVLVLFLLIQHQTKFARHLYAVGGNREAARLYGVPVRRLELLLYGLSGAVAGLAGTVLAARIESGEPNAGLGYELTAIGAVIIGGTRITGGEGGVERTVIGLLILGVIDNGLNLMNVPSFYQQIVKGGVIVLAVLIDHWARRRRS